MERWEIAIFFLYKYSECICELVYDGLLVMELDPKQKTE